jgi:hypothetical protein
MRTIAVGGESFRVPESRPTYLTQLSVRITTDVSLVYRNLHLMKTVVSSRNARTAISTTFDARHSAVAPVADLSGGSLWFVSADLASVSICARHEFLFCGLLSRW